MAGCRPWMKNAAPREADAAMNQQIQVLNAAFGGAGFSFHLSSVTRTDNATNESGHEIRWKTRGSGWEREMLRADQTDEPLRFLEKGSRYRIILRAVNGGGTSRWRRISVKLR